MQEKITLFIKGGSEMKKRWIYRNFPMCVIFTKGESRRICGHCGERVERRYYGSWTGREIIYCSIECLRAEFENSISQLENIERELGGY